MLRKWALYLTVFGMLLLTAGCGKKEDERVQESVKTEDTRTECDQLRVLSFNVRMDVITSGRSLSALSRNRIQAVREQILHYSPDLIGLQEDVQNWVDNIGIDEEEYVLYIPNEKMSKATSEYCSIYVKKELQVKDHGWKWITADQTSNTVALTYQELLDGDGTYDMSPEQLTFLEVDGDEALKASFTDKETGKNYGNKLASRLMNWVVLDVDGEDVIYVNTHLQHRGYREGAYEAHPLFLLRYYERCAQFDLIQKQIEELKSRYPEASIVITADFNDTSDSGFYERVSEWYIDAMTVAKTGEKVENTWNSAYNNDKQGQGYVSNVEGELVNRIDFCFVSKDLEDYVSQYQIGDFQWILEKSTATLGTDIKVYPSDHLPVVVDLEIPKGK